MLEKYIEKKLVAEVKKIGGIAAKFVSPGLDGIKGSRKETSPVTD